ncbi:hypothetical protein VD0002_g1855 [Verticillium dahliae]|uniref:Large ribosomal subunit protein bL17m n=2 Tax=Verticillium dahliae TaxID=27337 RepID=G2WUL1_VERDV|nr:50S ribosomal protein L17 [Verticillium dahliae VdLs.17]KAF3348196.1 KIN17-like protein [Verticillium dahliae VDG2]KAH6698621.1 50S ribosomal protein L17 [Verticillium dahliae]EGY17802.1 50S ribosomal protein L17 [Verticillium dahliae VdLs.17]PNH35677.1 hypothetical protein BJF96_g1490 [Verticillium dahliae]PNH50748.1 hypothetical protein VD0003_g6447 [Verticillium dahliae]
MAGGAVKYRHLSRHSAARQALLRGLVTSLVKHEHIQTTWPKAKEAQRLAEKLITLAKRDNEATRRKAQGILYTPHEILPKLFGELKARYAERPGGYTRVLRTEPRNAYDQAPSAILELVDGPRDLRFTMTAKAVARGQHEGWPMNDVTQKNVDKVTRYREGGKKALDKLVSQFKWVMGQQQRETEKKIRKDGEKETTTLDAKQ